MMRQNPAESALCSGFSEKKYPDQNQGKEKPFIMKNHKLWAWAMIFCLFMTVYTGYEHK